MLFHLLFRSLLPLKHHHALFFHAKCSFSSNIFSIQRILAHKLVHYWTKMFIVLSAHSVCSINLDSSKRIDACAIIRASLSLMESILLSNPQPIVYILLDVPVMYFYSCFSLEPDLIPDFSLQFHCI